MSKPTKGRPRKPASQKIVTTSIGIHPTALARLDGEARRAHLSRSALIVATLREKFRSVFDGL